MEDEQAYIVDIQSIKPVEVLSFDHTFKLHQILDVFIVDKKWICQYDSVFNGEGKTLSWQ